MREIIFRGKRIDNGEWVEGNLFVPDKVDFRKPPTEILMGTNIVRISYEVDPATVGQYTGLKDKTGLKRIFEGDIVKAQDDLIYSPFCFGIVGKVACIETGFFIEPKDPTESEYLFNECAVYEVLGNIHDNPELLEVR